jgi:inosose dehydratase
MGKIKVACETYTWQMPGESYKGKLDHIMGIVSKAGFAGIEPETSFFGDLTDPIKMKETLAKHNLEFAVLVHVEDWRNPKETDGERNRAQQWIDYLSHFPETIYLPVQMPGKDRSHLQERQKNLLSCVNALAERASAKGITCSYHPNSPMGSVFRTEEDYEILLNGLNAKHIGYTPDVGHIAKAGMDPLAIIKQYRELINLVHYKDMYADGRWAQTGEGVIQFKEITSYLVDTNYEGWIVMEDEADQAIKDPDGVTKKDGAYVNASIKPLL